MIAMRSQYEVVVIGAGHAGCEAARACARMGLRTALVTMNLDLIAQMSCNPAVGGIAKGHLVREIDALGGLMGEVTDAVGIQFRLLNTSRGPAVWSPRAQCDKKQYRVKMREVLEHVRAGKGPASVEFDTERFFGHFEGDPQRYRGPGEVDRLRDTRDCLKKFRESVTAAKLLEDIDLDAIDAEVMDVIKTAVTAARAAERPTAEDVLADVYISY